MARQVASGRTTATNRLAIQDVKSSLSFNGTNTYVQTPVVPNVNSFSFATKIYWHPPALVGGRTIFHCQDASGGIYIKHQNPSSRKLGVDTYNVGSATGLVSPSELSAGWHTIGVTRDATKTYMYVDGVLVNSVVCTMTAAASSVSRIGYSLANVQDWLGNMSGVILSNTNVFTAAEMLAYHLNGTIPTGATAIYKLDEGAGSTAYDSSGNGNNGTITNGTYVLDTPTKKRKEVNGNLVYNGDFEYAPAFTAATNTAGRWIDGTAGGSTTNNVLGWAYASGVGAATVRFDSTVLYNGKPTMRLMTAAGVKAEVWNCLTTTTSIMQNALKVTNQSYTLTCKIKTELIGGDANTGAFLTANLYTNSGAYSTTASYVPIKTTQDWTTLTVTHTPTTARVYMAVILGIKGDDGAGTLAMNAWFADVVVKPTTPTTRGTA